MKKLLVVLCSLFVLFAFAACGSGDSVATVNGEDITEKEYTSYLENLLKIYEINGYELTNEDKAGLKDTVIKELVNQKTVEQAAEELDCYPTEKEIDAYFDEKLKESFGDAQQGKEFIKSQGLDLDVYRYGYVVSLCEENIGKNQVAKNVLTKAEATATYEEAPESYDTRTLSHILIVPDTGDREVETDDDGNTIYTKEEWDAAKKKAEDLVKKLDKGDDFAALATENSADTNSAQQGGSLGEAVSRETSSFVEEFNDAAFALVKKGEYTKEPVKTVFGYHIIKADDVMTAENKTQIIKNIIREKTAEARSEAATTYIDNFRENSDIEYFALTKAAQEEIDKENAAKKEAAAKDSNTDDKKTKEETAE